MSIILNRSKYQIKYLLRKYGLKKRSLRLGKKLYDDRDWLYNEYMINKKGYTVIAKQCGVSYTTIRDRIMHFGWPIRSHNDIDKGEARRGQKHNPELILKIKRTRIKRRIVTHCNGCNKKIELKQSVFLKSKLNYCNYSCYKQFLLENRVETEDITDSAEYKQWRLNVYKRDSYRCKMPGCGSDTRDIAAHHIFPKKQYPDKAFNIDNGITLCRKCHEKTFGKEMMYINSLVRVIQTMNN
jgi:hypothetical protein